ncbi:hypothetical protein AT15_06010 [Kosmotoga arenicorallina S304]|uniref:Transcription regulator PadR N-terminal domain-containing protein n=1 Tax=Kosmotoga arenicorallina S304 TaxID=1453497 RepID=A0A182C7K8_9BACT|nr:PadR family transcriptional regulator [Kosmotoga arenicorallina]OAA31625.1 hypothetical protein AT15_06010 [Kosmotoga arenicorallina S304]
MHKGFLNVAIFNIVVKEHPIHGYRIMELIEEKMGYKPSPGSIYPILSDLVSKGYLRFEIEGKRKLYFPTKYGLKAHKEFESKRAELINNYIDLSHSISELMGESNPEIFSLDGLKHGNVPFVIRKALFKTMGIFKETNWKSKKSIERLITQLKALIDTLESTKDEVKENGHH